MIKRMLVALVAPLCVSASAQTSPGLSYGQIPTPGQWNSYFTEKMDFITPGLSGNVMLSNGTSWYSATPSFSGFVTSVGLILPNIFNVTNSPITSNGSLTGSLATQSANTVFSGPSSGSAAAPTFRALVSADLPNPNLAGTSTSIGGSSLAAGACASTAVSIAGATTAMAVIVTPVTYPGDGSFWHGYVSATGTVTVKVCESVSGTPTASTYNIRVIQ